MASASAVWKLCTTFVLIAGPMLVVAVLVSGLLSWGLARFGVQDPMLANVLRWCCVAAALYWSVESYSAELLAFTQEMWTPEQLSGEVP